MNTPNDASDEQIAALIEGEFKAAEYQAKVIDQVTALMAPAKIPELFFSTKASHRYVYDRVPVGHDLGWRCTDGNYDGPDSPVGYGLTQNEAYASFVSERDKDEPPPPRTKTVDAGRFEPAEVISAGSPSDWEHDDERDG